MRASTSVSLVAGLLVVVTTAFVMVPAPVGAQEPPGEEWKRCRANDPDTRVEACTALIGASLSATDLARAHHARGIAYGQRGLLARALDDFDAAIGADPSLVDAYGDRGITLTIMGRYTDAIADFSRVIEAHPRLAYPYYNRGVCYEMLGLEDLAIEDITMAIEIEPTAEFRYERRGTIYFRKKDFDRALADYEQALVINPQYAPALFGRGTVKLKTGDPAGGADIEAATRVQADIAAQMSRVGVR